MIAMRRSYGVGRRKSIPHRTRRIMSIMTRIPSIATPLEIFSFLGLLPPLVDLLSPLVEVEKRYVLSLERVSAV
jgi:hypothetical protein